MIHDPINEATPLRVRPQASPPRRRLIGGREILLLVIAFALLALVPSVAQIAPLGVVGQDKVTKQLGWDAEYPAENFPGSAFYFLDPDTMPSSPGSGLRNAARPFVMRAGTLDYSRALKCLTDAIYYEAANEPDAGQSAIAQVILNRMRHPTYPNTVCGVIYQGSERRTGCQFSYSCDGSMMRIPARSAWLRAQRNAAQALAGYVYSPVGMATHYHAAYVYPYWAPSLNFVGTIGAHRFYSWKGSAGLVSAFFRGHSGSEPFPGPKPRSWNADPSPMLDPVQLQMQFEREFATARSKAEAEARLARPYDASSHADISPSGQAMTASYVVPDYSQKARTNGGEANYGGVNLPKATNVKAEFQDSGSWIKQPTG